MLLYTPKNIFNCETWNSRLKKLIWFQKEKKKKTHWFLAWLFHLTFSLHNPPKMWVPQTGIHPTYYFYLYSIICNFFTKPFLKRSKFLSIKLEHLRVLPPPLIFKRKPQVLHICSLNIRWPFNSRKASVHNFWHLLKCWKQILFSCPSVLFPDCFTC